MFEITSGTEKQKVATQAEAMEVAGKFYAKGEKPVITDLSKKGQARAALATLANAGVVVAQAAQAARAKPQFSSFGEGKQVVDEQAKARIEKQHEAIRGAGAAVGMGAGQLFANGTRMMAEGYATQQARAIEHAKQTMPMSEVVRGLVDAVKAEQREDVTVLAGDLANEIKVDGVVMIGGRICRATGLRGILNRIESPSWTYLQGLRNRVEHTRLTAGTEDGPSKADAAALMDAAASPKYAAADAPEAVGDLLRSLPAEARGTFAYDHLSTNWSVRGSVWTPTPAQEQAVGEAFEAGIEFRSSDVPGSAKFRGGGYANVLRCLNASFYTAGADMERLHMGKIIADIEKMVAKGATLVGAVIESWGVARTQVIEAPTVEGIKLSRELALAGFFRGMLSEKRAEMVHVLPGKVEAHVEKLVEVYDSERRDARKMVKADLWQSFTKYAQSFEPEPRRAAENAAGKWLVESTPRFVGAEA